MRVEVDISRSMKIALIPVNNFEKILPDCFPESHSRVHCNVSRMRSIAERIELEELGACEKFPIARANKQISAVIATLVNDIIQVVERGGTSRQQKIVEPAFN